MNLIESFGNFCVRTHYQKLFAHDIVSAHDTWGLLFPTLPPLKNSDTIQFQLHLFT